MENSSFSVLFNMLGFETKEDYFGKDIFSFLKIFCLDNCCEGATKYLLTYTLYKSLNEL